MRNLLILTCIIGLPVARGFDESKGDVLHVFFSLFGVVRVYLELPALHVYLFEKQIILPLHRW
jgi:hypothetical protein